MTPDIRQCDEMQDPDHREVCDLLAREIDRALPKAESKLWRAHPVWFLDGNPTVGSSKQKPGMRTCGVGSPRRRRSSGTTRISCVVRVDWSG